MGVVDQATSYPILSTSSHYIKRDLTSSVGILSLNNVPFRVYINQHQFGTRPVDMKTDRNRFTGGSVEVLVRAGWYRL
jgi:hypothetical protein